MAKFNDLKQTLSEAHEKIRLNIYPLLDIIKMSSVITICFLGSVSSYEPQVGNINTVEETDAYKQYLLGGTKQIQRSKVSISQACIF